MADDQHEQPADPTDALEYLGRLALRELSMDSLLQTVADLTKTVMPGNPETSVSLLVKGRPTTVVSTGRLAATSMRPSTTRATDPACMRPEPAR